MKAKLWLKYIIYCILIFFILILWDYIRDLSDEYFNKNFSLNYGYITLSILIGICTGLLLGLEHFISEIRKKGIWKINVPKLVLVGIPSLYISLSKILIFNNTPFIKNIIAYPVTYILTHYGGYISIFQLIFGYIVITSFYKYNKFEVSV